MSEHFSELEWAAMARGAEAPGLRAHLAQGCPSCRAAYEFWEVLAGAVKAAPAPAASLQRSQALPGLQPRRRTWEGVRLAFDSLMFPQAQLVRDARTSRRHCVYELGEGSQPWASVEVLCERIGRQEGWSVVGQMLDVAGAGQAECAVRLAPLESGAAAVSTFSNSFGEFFFTRPDPGPWRLQVEWNDRTWDIAPVLTPER